MAIAAVCLTIAGAAAMNQRTRAGGPHAPAAAAETAQATPGPSARAERAADAPGELETPTAVAERSGQEEIAEQPAAQSAPIAAPAGPRNAAAPQSAPEAQAAAHPAGPSPAPPGGGDLRSAMQSAVGGAAVAEKTGDGSTAASPGAPRSNGSIPEQPSQGSVQASVRGAMGAAKACVAGADDVSRVQITFSSSGAVTGVSTGGWAASHGANGCLKAAFSGINVGAFSKPSFSVGVTVRP